MFTESSPRVVMYTKPGCHLCERAREVIAQICAEAAVEWGEVDISTDPALLREFAEQIPVTFVDGRQHDFWHVDPVRLRSALASGHDDTAPGRQTW